MSPEQWFFVSGDGMSEVKPDGGSRSCGVAAREWGGVRDEAGETDAVANGEEDRGGIGGVEAEDIFSEGGRTGGRRGEGSGEERG